MNHGFHVFNLTRLGEEVISTYYKLIVVAKDEAGIVIGGIHGEMYWEWLHIDTLWVNEDHRGQGIEFELLKQIK